jgi:hypothetical protein
MGEIEAMSEDQVNPVAAALRERCMDWNGQPMADEEEPRNGPTCAELRALADAYEYMQGRIMERETLLEQTAVAMRRMNETLVNMHLMHRISRFYLLNEAIELPDQKQVRAFIRAYVDDGRWLNIPWPDELPVVAKFLSDAGYINVGGMIHWPDPDQKGVS